jgi:hypothetical protein
LDSRVGIARPAFFKGKASGMRSTAALGRRTRRRRGQYDVDFDCP